MGKKTEFRQILGNARGLLLELDTHLELALRLNYLTQPQYERIGLMRPLTSNL